MSHTVQINIPCYQNWKVTEYTLRSIARQSFNSFEVCLYDNSDGENSAQMKAIVEMMNDKRFSYRSNCGNIGSYQNFIQCLENNNGAIYVMALAADICLLPTCLQTMVHGLEESGAVAVYPRVKVVDVEKAARDDFSRKVSDICDESGVLVSSIYEAEHDVVISGCEAARDLILHCDEGVYNSFSFTGSLLNSRIAKIAARQIARNDMFHGTEYYIDLLLFVNSTSVIFVQDCLLCGLIGSERVGDTNRDTAGTLSRISPITAMLEVLGAYRYYFMARSISVASLYKKVLSYALVYVRHGNEDRVFAMYLAMKALVLYVVGRLSRVAESSRDWKRN